MKGDRLNGISVLHVSICYFAVKLHSNDGLASNCKAVIEVKGLLQV